MDELNELLALLNANNVASYKDKNFEVEFHAPTEPELDGGEFEVDYSAAIFPDDIPSEPN